MRLSRVVLTYTETDQGGATALERTITITKDSIEFPCSKPYPREVLIAQRFYQFLKEDGRGEIPQQGDE